MSILKPSRLTPHRLDVVDRMIVQEQIDKATNCLWDLHKRPDNVWCTARRSSARELLPVIQAE